MESEEEEVTHTTDKFQQLLCHINQDVKYLHTGLVARMQVCTGASGGSKDGGDYGVPCVCVW